MTSKAHAANILIIEPERMLRDLLVSVLASEGFIVCGADSAAGAAQRLTDGENPHVVIVNPHIPDGWALVQSLRARPSTKVVALIASATKLYSSERLLVDAVLDKAASVTMLLATIRPLLPADAVPVRQESPLILVVDDEEEIRSLLSEFLSARGYTVLIGGSGTEALEIIESEPRIAVVLLDVILPERGGVDTLREIMKRKPHPSVIMISALADAEVAKGTIRLGAFDYLLKPIDLTALDGLIGASLAVSEAHRGRWSA